MPAALAPETSSRLLEVIYRHCGIRLGEKDLGVLRTRVGRRLQALEVPDYESYLAFITGDGGEREIRALIDAVTINYTYFFRDQAQFDCLSAEVFPTLLAAKTSRGDERIRVWSAGCSSGEEPYSIAITFHEAVHNADWYDFRVLATDINRRVLHAARRGVYPQERIAPIPAEWHIKYLVRDGATPPKHLRICAEIREHVTFKRFNLLHRADPMRGQLDIIFCRNVMMYFDPATRQQLLDRFRHYLYRGAYLFVGESDDLLTAPPGFTRIAPGVFRRG